MVTPTFCCGFECGGSASVDTLVGHLRLQAGGTIVTSPVRSGLRALRLNPAATSTYIERVLPASVRTLVLRYYQRFDVLPGGNVSLGGGFINGAGFQTGLVYQASDGSLYAGSDNGATFSVGSSGVSITADASTFHLIDIKIVTTANPWTIDVSVDGVALGQHTKALAAADITWLRLGNPVRAATYDTYYDDVLESQTSADYPIGAGKVISYVPAADGTHTATGTNIVKGTVATPVGAAITSATTDAFNWVNARPILGGATDATRLINQQTLLATQYAEVDFEPTAESTAPRAVEVLTADRQASTAVGVFSTKLNDNGTEDVIINRTGAGVTTDRFVTKQYATMVGGGAWTLARFNALKARFGYSSDATPDQYWRGIMIEAEFAVAAAVAAAAPRSTILRQAVNRASTY